MSPLSEYRNAVCKTTYSVWYSKKWDVWKHSMKIQQIITCKEQQKITDLWDSSLNQAKILA